MKPIGIGPLNWDSISFFLFFFKALKHTLLIFVSQKEPDEAAEGSPCTLYIINVIKYTN